MQEYTLIKSCTEDNRYIDMSTRLIHTYATIITRLVVHNNIDIFMYAITYM